MILRAGYTFFLWLLLPVIAARLWMRSRREPGYARNLAERFGRYEAQSSSPLIWVHAVSVGEVRASLPLVNALRKAYPGHGILVTCMTAAGREAIEQVFGDSVIGVFLPYDYPFAVSRFLDYFRPDLAILMETEIWINLIAACRKRALPLVLANARMSARSAKRYRRLSVITRPAFEALSIVCAQSEDDANRIASLGAHHVEVSGNLKFDVQPDARLVHAGDALRNLLNRKHVLLMASTREGEETLLLESLKRQALPNDAAVVLVPRHPQRFDEAASLILAAGFHLARRSSGQALSERAILLGDTMGEMPTYYAASDVAIIGGSLLPFGGQNLIEACATGVPVVIGPHVHNFSEAVRLAVECNAAIQVADADGALRTALSLLSDPERRADMSRAGKAFCALHRGATQRHIAAIRSVFASERRDRSEPSS